MGKLETLRDVIEFSKAHSLPADVVGRWVWLRFPEKPPEETRALIKAAGFAWVKKRGQWAHSCGAYTWKRSKTPYEPRQKYGAVPVSAIDPEITS